jgi:hypothetical protein
LKDLEDTQTKKGKSVFGRALESSKIIREKMDDDSKDNEEFVFPPEISLPLPPSVNDKENDEDSNEEFIFPPQQKKKLEVDIVSSSVKRSSTSVIKDQDEEDIEENKLFPPKKSKGKKDVTANKARAKGKKN